ncbi:MAG: thermonuclease family protein [Thermomicrobiales bacterium]|nr:thermonuclease family protein [Thermomicrobiales bacterium]
MPQHSWSQAAHRSPTPDVPRPDLAIWQPLESERVRWEGQVLIVGQDSDLPALLVITGKRLALIAGGEIALEFPLAWMRPEPKLLTENGIRLYISPDGDSQIAQPMVLRAKAGRGAALEIAAVLTGRTFTSRTSESPMHVPDWKTTVGAAPSVALPELNENTPTKAPQSKAAWPPAETTAVDKAARPSADIVPWRTGSSMPQPRPVPTETSRAARLLGTSSDGYTITESLGRTPVSSPQKKHHFPMWLLNLAIAAMLIAGFSYVAVDRGWDRDDFRALVPGNVASMIGWEESTAPTDIALAPETLTPESAVTSGGDNTLLPVKNTTITPTPVPTETPTESVITNADNPMDSIGGASNLPVTASVVGTPMATEDVPALVETPEEIATETPTEMPTEVATTEPTAIVTEVPTTEPTEVATAVVPFDPTVPQTEEEETPVVAPTQSVVTTQKASVADGSIPNQQFQQGGLRYSIDAIETGAAVPSLPEINNVGKTWVVLTVTGTNTGSSDIQFNMADFTLLADGNAITLDTGTAWVNNLLGNDPAYGYQDFATWAPGEQHRFTLVFLAPTNVDSLVLVAGDQQIALDAAITNAVALTDVATDTAPAATVSGTVVEVIDGQTIVVDVDGELITVRYLGVEAPTGDACYAAQATEANAELVEGQTVTLERQNVDTNARGVWVRDVWVSDSNGEQMLVGQALIEQGAAQSKVSAPNNRYQGWFESSQQQAENTGAGLWSSCGN